jgi:hypothetical protein
MLNINKDIAYSKALTCTNVTDKKTVKHLFKTRCKWGSKDTWPCPSMRLQVNRMENPDFCEKKRNASSSSSPPPPPSLLHSS